MSERVAEEVLRTGAITGQPDVPEGWRVDVTQHSTSTALQHWTITCTKGSRVLLVRQLLAPTS